MRFTTVVSVFAFLCACGDDGGGGSGGGGGGGGADAPNVPAMITVSGTASERSASGSMARSGVAIEAYRTSDPNTPVATATTDASGNYSLQIATNGAPLDGYIKASLAGLLDTYLYPPKPLVADFTDASINMVTANTLGLLSNLLCRDEQDLANGIIAVLVVDAADMPVAGAKVSSSPSAPTYCYNMGGTPNSDATMTDVDGIAYMINVPAGNVTVSASKSGITFSSHSVNARAGALTTTPIQP